ncbi:MAG: hypothetical protein HC911_04565 [Chloroflexaceae bacterium]|nr:hypothetical protein [Chloroflexaceae bacterium]
MRLWFIYSVIFVLAGTLAACGNTPAPPPPATATVAPAPTPPTPRPTELADAPPAITPSNTAAPTPAPTEAAEATEAAGATDTPPAPSSTALTYYWPSDLPRGLEVLNFASYADERGFMLTLQNPQDRQYFMQITGGQATTFFDAVPSGAQSIQIRQQEGYEFSTGGGWSFHWQTGNHGYSVGGIMDRNDTLAVAEGLAPISLAAFQERLDTTPLAGTEGITATSTPPAKTISSGVPVATITALSNTPPIPLTVITVTASSTLPPEDLRAIGLGIVRYAPELTRDNRPDTAWVEGVPGAGIGEWIRFEFAEPVLLVRMSISAGLERDEEIFRRNHRPQRLLLTYADGSSDVVQLADQRGPQAVPIAYKLTDVIQLTIEEVYPSARYDDTPITEVQFFGYPLE